MATKQNNTPAKVRSRADFQALVSDALADTDAIFRNLGIDKELFRQCALQAFITNPDVNKCDDISLTSEIAKAIHAGVVLDGNEAVLVPHGDRATVYRMIEGDKKLAFQAMPEMRIEMQSVFEGELFSYSTGLTTRIHHEPSGDVSRKFDNLIATYAIVWRSPQDVNPVVMVHYKDDTLHYRGKSAAFNAGKKGSPWFTDPLAMAKKSCLRQALRLLPKGRPGIEPPLDLPTEDDWTVAAVSEPIEESGDPPPRPPQPTEDDKPKPRRGSSGGGKKATPPPPPPEPVNAQEAPEPDLPPPPGPAAEAIDISDAHVVQLGDEVLDPEAGDEPPFGG